MIKRYRIKSSLENYGASFEMILDSNSPGVKPTLMHLRNLISKYEDKWVDSRTFSESYKEIEVLGNSMHDLDPKS